jgi:hypothetical protein
MRPIRSILYAVGLITAVSAGFVQPSLAGGSWADCHRPPPAWYTAPRVTYTYSNSYSSGYGRTSTHEYSAQRRYSSSQTHRYHDPFARW